MGGGRGQEPGTVRARVAAEAEEGFAHSIVVICDDYMSIVTVPGIGAHLYKEDIFRYGGICLG